MSKVVGVGLIGCGSMGSTLAQACNKLEHARVVAAADTVEAGRQKLSSELGTVTFQSSDYRALLEQDSLQAVLIALPGFLHAEVAVAAAQAGKHVFTEKPMAVSLDDCDRMITACNDANVKLMVGQVCRYHAVHRQIKQMVQDGRIGRPTCMVVRRLGGPWGGVWRQTWRMERARCGGTLMEVNAHEIDFLRWVCGEVAEVTASGGKYLENQQDYEDIVLVNLRFAGGALGHLHSSNASAIGEYGGRIDGTEGSLTFPSFWGESAGIHCKHANQDATFLRASDIPADPPVRAELHAFVDSILQDTDPPITGADGRAVVEIALAAYESAASGRSVAIARRS